MRSQMFAAAIAMLAFTASASAQLVPTVPDTQATAVTLPDTTKATKHNGHVATATRGYVMQATGNYWCSSCQNAQRCNNGTGSCRADLGFAVRSGPVVLRSVRAVHPARLQRQGRRLCEVPHADLRPRPRRPLAALHLRQLPEPLRLAATGESVERSATAPELARSAPKTPRRGLNVRALDSRGLE